jgi:hypothetical protein
VVLRGLLFSLNVVPKPRRMLSVRTDYVLGSLQVRYCDMILVWVPKTCFAILSS